MSLCSVALYAPEPIPRDCRSTLNPARLNQTYTYALEVATVPSEGVLTSIQAVLEVGRSSTGVLATARALVRHIDFSPAMSSVVLGTVDSWRTMVSVISFPETASDASKLCRRLAKARAVPEV